MKPSANNLPFKLSVSHQKCAHASLKRNTISIHPNPEKPKSSSSLRRNPKELGTNHRNVSSMKSQDIMPKKCPNKRAKAAKLVHQLEQIADEVPSDVDIESIFSEQEKRDDSTTFFLQDLDSVSCSEYSDSSEADSIQDSYQATQISPQSGPNPTRKILKFNYCHHLL